MGDMTWDYTGSGDYYGTVGGSGGYDDEIYWPAPIESVDSNITYGGIVPDEVIMFPGDSFDDESGAVDQPSTGDPNFDPTDESGGGYLDPTAATPAGPVFYMSDPSDFGFVDDSGIVDNGDGTLTLPDGSLVDADTGDPLPPENLRQAMGPPGPTDADRQAAKQYIADHPATGATPVPKSSGGSSSGGGGGLSAGGGSAAAPKPTATTPATTGTGAAGAGSAATNNTPMLILAAIVVLLIVTREER